ncbi:MAG: inner membrane CreD family protein [Coriobacteriales bacterium]|nr:inner membrane CreD family protein [Coriobacteriales bacterium]
MSGRRLFAIIVIFVLAAGAWMVLAGSVQLRTDANEVRLGDEVSGLWGAPQVQEAPEFRYTVPGTEKKKGPRKSRQLDLVASDIAADFTLDQRRKGLLWYATYVVDFDAAYRVSNPTDHPVESTMRFRFPDPSGSYDGFTVRVDGEEVPVRYESGNATAEFKIEPGAAVSVDTGYRTNGMDNWAYRPSPGGASVIRDFELKMKTDFGKIDYPASGVSPTTAERSGSGWDLVWKYESVVSGREIGLVMPSPLNPGPLVARITAFAPVSLLFFFAALILLTATRSVRLHPVHYGFIAAAFFAFDLLLAYLADQIDINIAFVVAAATSVALVVGYLFVVVGKNVTLVEIAISQFVFLVLFSYSFFFEGFTGLAITVGAILTLAFFMAKTARVDWEAVFPRRGSAQEQPPQPMGDPVQTPQGWVAD